MKSIVYAEDLQHGMQIITYRNKGTGTKAIHTKLYYNIFSAYEVLASDRDKYSFKELRGI